MQDMMILIELDSKACRSMARRLRAEQVFCRILPAAATADDLRAQSPRGVLLAGADRGEPGCIPHLDELLACGLPVMAMGDAALSLALQLGCTLGEKQAAPGLYPVQYEGAEALFADISSGERYIPACRSITLSAACHPIAQTGESVLGFRAAGKSVYGLAFLPESNDPDGTQLLLNFCRNVCGCTAGWNLDAYLDSTVEELRRVCGDAEALCAISGGLDSGVSAVLGHQALGQKLHCLLIDTGLLRKGECEAVLSLYRDALGMNVHLVDAGSEILSALAGVNSSRQKEIIVHDLLQHIIRRELEKRPAVKALIRGTNYTDTLDSPTANDLPDGLQLIEPVRELFKDEVRTVAGTLFLPDAIIRRQPFPGSGLALRILADVTEEKLDVLREADAIFRREIDSAGHNKRLWQYYAILSDEPVEDESGYVIILRAVQVIDGDVGIASRVPYDLLERTAAAILSTLPAVRRVLYDLSPSNSYARSQVR